jgi:hypothetical protein
VGSSVLILLVGKTKNPSFSIAAMMSAGSAPIRGPSEASTRVRAMPLSVEADKFVKVASASLPRVSEIIAAFSDDDRAGAFELAEWRYAQAARDFGCDEAESKRWRNLRALVVVEAESAT